ncbi:MAG TPA: hypothetical protein VIF11_15865 [Methylomirabilota bacterium]
MKPRTPTSFRIIPAHSDGKPVVVLDFGKLGQITLSADDVDRFVAELERNIREARKVGET